MQGSGLHRLRPLPHGLQGGSVLILTVILTSLFLGVVASYSASVRTQIEEVSESGTALQAELAAQSGLEFAKTQLMADAGWTGSDKVALGEGRSFSIIRVDDPLVDPNSARLVIEGNDGGASYRMEAFMDIVHGDPLANAALAILGGSGRIHNSELIGDVLITDDTGITWDWNPQLGDWVEGGPASVEGFQFTSNDSDATLCKYTDQMYGGWESQRKMRQAVYMPAYDTEGYKDPQHDIVYYDNPASIRNVTFYRTVVVDLDPGKQLVLENCCMFGGLVVNTPGDLDPRAGAVNQVKLRQFNWIGGEDQGKAVHTNVGVIAPVTEMVGDTGHPSYLFGYNMVNGMNTSVHMEIQGQLVVVNELENLNNSKIGFDAEVVSDPPFGIRYGSPPPSVSVTLVRELFDPVQIH